jgi:hypothetical protein
VQWQHLDRLIGKERYDAPEVAMIGICVGIPSRWVIE